MRKLAFLALLLITTTLCHAQGIGNVKFGSTRDVATKAIEDFFGEPSKIDDEVMIYTNKVFEGFHWNEVLFKFKDSKLVEARFFMNQKNKSHAKKQLTEISKTLSAKHVMTKDIEDDGNTFYAGGKSPLYYGHLFTLFISPRNGLWTDQLRFGPFKF
jgi:hypothetical protein